MLNKIKNTDTNDHMYLCFMFYPCNTMHLSASFLLSSCDIDFENSSDNFDTTSTRLLFENHLLSHSENIKNFNAKIKLDSVSTIKKLVSSNLGIIIISHSAVKEEEASDKLIIVPIENMNMIREINIVHHNEYIPKY